MISKNPSAKKKETVRIFFALWPNTVIQKQFAHWAKTHEPVCGGRRVKTQNIHLTLAFLGDVTIDRLPELQIAANKVTAKAFNLTIQETGYWKHPQIIYAQAESYPTALLFLTESLRNELSKAKFVFDNKTFKPHVTLIRKAKCLAGTRLAKPIQWHAKEWRLIQSKQTNYGIDYIPLQRWFLE